MVKVGILGADHPLAGEVIRILIHHPETELVSMVSSEFLGRNLSSIHHGLIGETPLYFTDKIDLEDIDFLVILNHDDLATEILRATKDSEDLKLVLTDNEVLNPEDEDIEIGLSEFNRKALVRGSKRAYIPSPVIVPSLISLAPLASFLLLNSDIEIEVSLPSDLAEKFNEEKESEKLEKLLKTRQTSFRGKIHLKIHSDQDSERSVLSKIKFTCGLSLEEIEKIYDQIYDDHNFSFVTLSQVNPREVEGTQKTVISLKKEDEDTLTIETLTDGRLRGGAGDMVHVMNLFFGLHEKTGLYLKPSRF